MQDLKHHRLLSALSDTITRKLKTPSWILLMGMSVLVTAGAHAKSVLIVGDSLSAGYGIDPQNGWVNKLQTTLDLKRKGQHQNHQCQCQRPRHPAADLLDCQNF